MSQYHVKSSISLTYIKKINENDYNCSDSKKKFSQLFATPQKSPSKKIIFGSSCHPSSQSFWQVAFRLRTFFKKKIGNYYNCYDSQQKNVLRYGHFWPVDNLFFSYSYSGDLTGGTASPANIFKGRQDPLRGVKRSTDKYISFLKFLNISERLTN